MLADLVVGARFLGALPSFLRPRITPPEARRALRHRLEHRQARFLTTMRRAAFDHGGVGRNGPAGNAGHPSLAISSADATAANS